MKIQAATEQNFGLIGELTVKNWQQTYAGLLDADFLAELSPEHMAEDWEKYSSQQKHYVFTAYEGDVFLGFVACKPETEPALENCLYLDSLHVAQNARGKGVGTALIKTVLQLAKDNGYRGVSICIVRGNDTARRLYAGLGAVHYKDFEDDFHGTAAHSEKLLWKI